MLRRIIITALSAGVLAGIFIWGLQMVTTIPLIDIAEVFEASGGVMAGGDGHDQEAAGDEHAGDDHDVSAWMPEGGMERHAFTFLSSILLGVGFGAILTAVFAFRGKSVGFNQGILWGLGGFAALYVAPTFGLPPEIPGMMAADFSDRQLWWVFAAGGASIGLAMMVFNRRMAVRIAGVVPIVIPHLVGAPHPALEDIGGGPPAELAAQFAVVSLVTVGLFWIVLGALSGYFYDHFAEN